MRGTTYAHELSRGLQRTSNPIQSGLPIILASRKVPKGEQRRESASGMQTPQIKFKCRNSTYAFFLSHFVFFSDSLRVFCLGFPFRFLLITVFFLSLETRTRPKIRLLSYILRVVPFPSLSGFPPFSPSGVQRGARSVCFVANFLEGSCTFQTVVYNGPREGASPLILFS